MIYVFGNSHAHTFTNSDVGLVNSWGNNKNENFTSFSLGPVIAYNFIEHHYNRLIDIISNLNIKSDDYILLAIGEVDCRWHIPYQADIQKRNIDEVVKECVDRFFRAHLNLKSIGYNVIGWGGHPSTVDGHSDDSQRPIFGDCLRRNEISKLWVKYLSENCISHSIPFVSIIDDIISEDGMTKMEYFSDYCHLNYDKVSDIINTKFKEKKIIL